ncbi:MAG TPA: hypothetical protein VKK31_01885 [Thermoanaerobaculia bacterium]|nr:hypothetical protein [Thermoanaerobaculia bacterium]
MVPHQIAVSFSAQDEVSAEHNPSPNDPDPVGPGDIVTWEFTPSAVGRNLRVSFRQVIDLTTKERESCQDLGPFSSLSRNGSTIVGTIRSDVPSGTTKTHRYIYKIVDDSSDLQWLLPFNSGGLDTPGKPPGN